MLQLLIKGTEMYDEKRELFITTKDTTLTLEHSLVSLSKWESKWHKPFISKEVKTNEEIIDYIKCMTITQNVDPYIYNCITKENVKTINDYIENPMTATWFTEHDKVSRTSSETVTSELIYYWMVALNIDFKCEKWHLNRLLTLIRICNIKNKPPKKMNKRDVLSKQASLNAARRKQSNSTG